MPFEFSPTARPKLGAKRPRYSRSPMANHPKSGPPTYATTQIAGLKRKNFISTGRHGDLMRSIVEQMASKPIKMRRGTRAGCPCIGICRCAENQIRREWQAANHAAAHNPGGWNFHVMIDDTIPWCPLRERLRLSLFLVMVTLLISFYNNL
ncbi:hypothetical protein TWF730_008232 [Orbilia blumenaviensis]|uniref:Uncharacterized protein n=1 Tax=Orbilia blumenaviensis TaxID=1796055 RepID=A0AAV9V8D4_9PEZI